MWQKLLIPHDLSPLAAHALRTAVELAKVHGSQLALLHVSELPANLPPETLVSPADATGPVRVDDDTTRGARDQLEAVAAPLRSEGLVVRTIAVVGDIAERILAVSTEIGADALVVGTHGRKGLPSSASARTLQQRSRHGKRAPSKTSSRVDRRKT